MVIDGTYYELDLQLFASAEDEGRTERPTEKRLREEREKGRVAKSSELTSAVVLLVGIIVLSMIAKNLFSHLLEFTRGVLSRSYSFNIGMGNYRDLLVKLGYEVLRLVLPIMLIAFIISFLMEVLQVGFVFSLKPLKPKMSKISFTVQKLMNRVLFSKQVAFNLVKAFFKVSIIGLIAFLIIKSELIKISRTIDMNVGDSFSLIAWISFKVIVWSALLLLFISIVDYFFQKYQFMESVKMSVYEVKEERKQYEGDPLVKARQRERQRELMMRRMMQEVPKADIVITNPTHIAVAIRYDLSFMLAPEVVAKGMGFIAERIREVAEEYGIYIMENKDLARELYYSVDIGDQIPEDLFQAVAELLTFVYRLKKKAV